ncbi:alpha/beta fold hydrolase [Marinivivus vitaminiproducens]|uniref:alpha/beta fold hydrolase n=1 Tax=Marinivivus vitaminiproducens TaxID=3035935 RepID=UPI0027AA4CE1|nr:alpha/beta fold hydrolase [Geminicoccaceae bacterium SCSIO 64248]
MGSNGAVALNGRSQGEGAPVLFLHGLFGAGRNFEGVARKLAGHAQVWTLDLRNHGQSAWSDEMTYTAMAADLAAFIEAQGLHRPAVIGHSMGGKAAMALALTQPDRVGRLLVADIAPVTYGRDLAEYAFAMRDLDLEGIARRSEADAVLKPSIPDATVRAFLLQNLVPSPEGGLAWRLNLDAIAGSIDDIVGFPAELETRTYDGPALFLHGGASDYVRPEHEPAIRRLFPNAVLDAMPEAHHWLHADQPDLFRAKVTDFLA